MYFRSLITCIDTIVFTFIKRQLYQAWLRGRVFLAERRRWRGSVERQLPLVFYGHEHLPAPDEAAAGGILKCHDLSQSFPNILRGGNILYLVSSALPALPERVVSYAKRGGAKFVLNQNGVAYPAYHGDGCERINAPRRVILGAADIVLYQSIFCKRSSDKFLGPCSSPWKILYNPVDTTFFRPNGSERPGISPLLLLAGSHHFRYRVVSAVATVAVLKKRRISARLLIAGRLRWLSDEKSCLDDLRKICVSFCVGEAVEYCGPYTQMDAPELMNRADILLHTKYLDPCPRLVVEAMACGVPVVYSASGGVPELVGDEAGVGIEAPEDYDRLHPPEPDFIADGVAEVLSDYRRFSQAARDRAVTRFDLAPWVESHRELFEGLLH